MNNVARIAVLVAASLLTFGTLPATADEGRVPTCEEAVRGAQGFFTNMQTDEANFESIGNALEPVAEACPSWSTLYPAANLAMSTTFNAANAATSPVYSNVCSPGGAEYDDIPVVVTFKVGGASVAIEDKGPGGVSMLEDGTLHYWVQGKVVGIEGYGTGDGWITLQGAGQVLPGDALVKPLCLFDGAGTCGGETTVESNTDRLSATGYSTFFLCSVTPS